MAWASRARIPSSLIRQKTRRYHALRPDNPHGVPTVVMRQLQCLRLPTPDKEIYTGKLVELMRTIEINGGG
jgi:hypothetical protein